MSNTNWFIESISLTECALLTKKQMEKLLPSRWEEYRPRQVDDGSIFVHLRHINPSSDIRKIARYDYMAYLSIMGYEGKQTADLTVLEGEVEFSDLEGNKVTVKSNETWVYSNQGLQKITSERERLELLEKMLSKMPTGMPTIPIGSLPIPTGISGILTFMPTVAPTICPKYGAYNQPGAKICNNCGAALEKTKKES